MKHSFKAASIALLVSLMPAVGAAEAVEIYQGRVEAAQLLEVAGEGAESSSWKPNRISAKLRQLAERLRLIYQRHLDSGGAARGELSVKFKLGDDGYVDAVEVIRERLGDEELLDELLDNMATWYILPNRDEDNAGGVSVFYRFDFCFTALYVPLAVEPLEPDGVVPPMRRLYWLNEEIAGRLVDINELYNIYLLANPALEGDVMLRFVLRHDGSIDGVELVEEDLGARGLVVDIIAKVDTWRLSGLDDYGPEGDVLVTYTFILNSAF